MFSDFLRITSTGKDASSPHCSWRNTCEFDGESKLKCAVYLCKAQGFNAASFVESSNNFCTSSYSSEKAWVYRYDTNEVKEEPFGRTLVNALWLTNEASITANCRIVRVKLL